MPLDDKGTVRLLIADVSTDPAKQLLTDEQVQGFIDLEGGSLKRAAASALDAIASSESLVSKVIQTQDLKTDGTKVATDLRAHADRLREQAGEVDDFAFSVVYPVTGCRPELTGQPTVWGL